jgi:Cu2+-exporting ATPase
VVAHFEFDDVLRPDVRDVLRGLETRGIKVEILSGDSAQPVAKLASTLGIHSFRAEVLPGEKSAHIAALTAQGRKVLMVGDGLNDTPALMAAHVSMAPATAADVGRNAADFVFLQDSLRSVLTVLDVAKRSAQLIRQNFVLAVLYNLIALPIAVLGYATPLVAALAMSSSSIIVVANALRLREKSSGAAI